MLKTRVDLFKAMSDFQFKIDQVHNESMEVQRKNEKTEEKFKIQSDKVDRMDARVNELDESTDNRQK